MLEITKEQLEALLFKKYGKVIKVSDKKMANYKAERTIEGRSINNSLTTLGNCVKEVAKVSQIPDAKLKAKKMAQIAWRASSLTRLLKSALAGTCKTIMIAAISPSLSELPETLSTMRYANAIKQIKTSAVKTVVKLTEEQKQAARIKELEDLIAKAMAGAGVDMESLGAGAGGGGDGGGGVGGGGGDKETKELLKQKAQLEKQMAENEKKEKEMETKMARLREESKERDRIKSAPHLLLIVNNPMTSGIFPTELAGEVLAGPSENAHDNTYPVRLKGAGVQEDHAKIVNSGGTCTLTPMKGSAMINGKTIKQPTVLHHNDRVRLGEDNWFRVIMPTEMEAIPPSQREKDDVQYNDYDFLKEEAMSEIMKNFELGNEENEELRSKQLKEDLKIREKEYAEKKKAMDAMIAQERRDHDRKMAELEEKLLREQERAEEELQAASDERRKAILAENKIKEKELRSKLALEKRALQANLDKQKDSLTAKLEEEKKARDDLVKKELEAVQARENARAKLHYDLLDAISPVNQANHYAREMGVKSQFQVIITRQDSGGELVHAVTVELTDLELGITEQWEMQTFRFKFGQLVQEYSDNQDRIAKHLPPILPLETPFHVTANAPQVIGHAKIMLNYLYFGMAINDTFNIVSYTGHTVGQLIMSISLVWRNEDEEEVADLAESVADIPDLKCMDLEFSIKKCLNLPVNLASDVRCRFSLPDWINNHILPFDYKEKMEGKQREAEAKKAKKDAAKALRKNELDDDESSSSSDDEEEEDKKEDEFEDDELQRGGTYTTTWMPESSEKLTVNPNINYCRVIRIANVTRKVKEWLRDAELAVTVLGTHPSDMQQAKHREYAAGEQHEAQLHMAQVEEDQELLQARLDLQKSIEDQEKTETELEAVKKQLEDLKNTVYNKTVLAEELRKQQKLFDEAQEKQKKKKEELVEARLNAKQAGKIKARAKLLVAQADKDAEATTRDDKKAIAEMLREVGKKERVAADRIKKANAKNRKVKTTLEVTTAARREKVKEQRTAEEREEALQAELVILRKRAADLEKKVKSKLCVVS